MSESNADKCSRLNSLPLGRFTVASSSRLGLGIDLLVSGEVDHRHVESWSASRSRTDPRVRLDSRKRTDPSAS